MDRKTELDFLQQVKLELETTTNTLAALRCRIDKYAKQMRTNTTRLDEDMSNALEHLADVVFAIDYSVDFLRESDCGDER